MNINDFALGLAIGQAIRNGKKAVGITSALVALVTCLFIIVALGYLMLQVFIMQPYERVMNEVETPACSVSFNDGMTVPYYASDFGSVDEAITACEEAANAE